MGLGAVLGLLTGFLGIVGAFMIVPAVVLAGHFPTQHAVSTSLLVITMTIAAALIGHLHLGTVALGIVGIFVLGSAAGIVSGSALGGYLPDGTLDKAFGWFIILFPVYVHLFPEREDISRAPALRGAIAGHGPRAAVSAGVRPTPGGFCPRDSARQGSPDGPRHPRVYDAYLRAGGLGNQTPFPRVFIMERKCGKRRRTPWISPGGPF